MSNRKTSRRMSALTCCAAVLIAAGCGGSGSKSSSSSASAGTSTSSDVERTQACAFATEAATVYRTATARAGLKFSNKPLMRNVITTAGQLRARVQQLRALTSGPQVGQLAALDAALAQQQVVIAAIVRNDFKTAGEHARGLNEGLSSGLANLSKICTGL